MDNDKSITEFFYNIIPGAFFILYLERLGFNFIKQFLSDHDILLALFSIILLSLFLGFFFQAVTKIIRNKGWNKRTSLIIKESNLQEFTASYKSIYKKSPKSLSKEQVVQMFYLMDCGLRADYPSFLPTHFSSRFAFWSNNLIMFSLLFFISLFKKTCADIEVFALLFLSLFSLYIANEYFQNYYDTVLKCFFIKIKRDTRDN